MNCVFQDPDYGRLKDQIIASTGLVFYANRDQELTELIGNRLSNRGLRECSAYARLVADGEKGQALHLAPSERHMRLDAGRLRLDAGAHISFQRPSGTVLFESMARDLGVDALGVLLTGMGEDGASGLLEIRRSGGYTIAEDESTAVVYGMPAAVRMGAVCESLPLPAIATRVLELVSCKSS